MNSLKRKTAASIGDVMMEYIKHSSLAPQLNSRRIFEAWNTASGAERYTIRRFFRDGKLYITVNSSVVCSQLQFQREALVEKMNEILRRDELFIQDNSKVGFVKELVIK